MNQPFTPEEEKIMNLLVEAHRKFMKLPQSHPNEKSEWVTVFHQLQNIVCYRVVQRDYPERFTKPK